MAKAKTGWLRPSDFAASMSVTHPLYPRGPYYYRDCQAVSFVYRTDDEEALSRLPAELEMVEPATAVLTIAQNGYSTVAGGYCECYLGFLCRYQGELMLYSSNLYETKENASIIGREIYGFPKKLCETIEFTTLGAGDVRITVDLEGDHRLLTAMLRPSENVALESLDPNPPLVVLKIVPDAEGSTTPSLAQLVKVQYEVTPIVGSDGRAEVFTGPGRLNFDQPSDIAVPVREMVSCTMMRFNGVLPYGTILNCDRVRLPGGDDVLDVGQRVRTLT